MSGDLKRLFSKLFDRQAQVRVRAPGRVNLIGEHTDYNGGFVFPAAINRYITVLASARADSRVRAYSLDLSEQSSFNTAPIEDDQTTPWSNYIRGVIQQYQNRGLKVPGMDLIVAGNVPIGAGLGSSAAFEVAVAEACRILGRLRIDGPDMALLCQQAEHEFVGVKCGIMDQFISVMARENSALFLDCRELSHTRVPLGSEASIVVCNSRVQRTLDNSEYNLRRAECEEAVRLLAQELPGIKTLRDVEPGALEANRSLLSRRLFQRARHVLTENARVLAAVEALKKKDLGSFGKLLAQSHDSLREDYQVSCRELDLLVELAHSHPGTLGARMTGAGFGGCTVNLVRPDQAASFCECIREGYISATGTEPHTYIFRASQGVHSVCLDENPLHDRE